MFTAKRKAMTNINPYLKHLNAELDVIPIYSRPIFHFCFVYIRPTIIPTAKCTSGSCVGGVYLNGRYDTIRKWCTDKHTHEFTWILFKYSFPGKMCSSRIRGRLCSIFSSLFFRFHLLLFLAPRSTISFLLLAFISGCFSYRSMFG